jgi:mannose-1-phosphate guanylyltransferase/mannose-1-phosphate guanylyltransferase/mannose-6-phosphate isomerase
VIYPVILCGGAGTRLWPLSRQAYPKQFAALTGDESLYQATLRRLTGEGFGAPLIMTADDYRFLATDQAVAIGLTDAKVVIEPSARDTAPAILTAALMLEDKADAQMLIAPSDHVIADLPAFLAAVAEGETAANGGSLVTFGVTPTRPETGYGYLELSSKPKSNKPVKLASFREKPELEAAQDMIAAGNFLWNAGIFLARVADVIKAFETHAPEFLDPCRAAVKSGTDDLGFFRLGEAAYASARAISFDYAVMEKAANVAAVPMDCGWTDLGSWDALWQMGGPNDAGVVTHGESTAIDCKDSYLRSDEGSMQVVGLGLDGVVAVAMRDAVLIASKDRAQDVKKAVTALRAQSIGQANDYPRFHRPWGWYETLCLDKRFQVKRIMVKPGGILSLQSHVHRSEHWVVVDGTAEVTIGENVQLVSENQSVYIPLGTKHRMANPGKVPMYLIEVQTGTYFGEDDIVRYEDVYNRS